MVYAYRLPIAAQFAARNGLSDVEWERIAVSLNGTATIGTQVVAADFDHDGDIDFATAGKLGVHIFENLKIDHTPKPVREATQPINRVWPFPGEGKDIPQDDLPTSK